MFYVEFTLDSHPESRTHGVEIKTQSLNSAVQRVMDFLNGYTASCGAVGEIIKVSRDKSRGMTYTTLEELAQRGNTQ